MVNPSNKIEVKIKDIVFEVNYPKSGEMIEIAVLKSKLSDNQYPHLQFQRSLESGIVIKLLDAYSFFTVMVKDMKKHLGQSMYDLEIIDAVELVHAYDNIVLPWMDSWTELINNKIDELQQDKKGNSKSDLI